MLLDNEGLVKVGDYNLAVQLNCTASEREAVFGTTYYMAPEVFEGKTCLKSDVWSLGISLIEMAEGKHPFEGYKIMNVIKHVLNKEPPSLSSGNWSPDFVDFVGNCLKRNVDERWNVYALMDVTCAWEE